MQFVDCVDGRFGVNCDNICHCKDGPCNKSTGVCPSASCKNGFTGEKCTKGRVTIQFLHLVVIDFNPSLDSKSV